MQGRDSERRERDCLSFDGFCRCVRIDIEHKINSADVKIQKVLKNNGRELYALVIMEEGAGNIIPTIYLEGFYKGYLQGMRLREIEQIILEIYQKHKLPPCFNADFFKDWNQVKDSIVFKVINAERNREFLKRVPYFSFLDLAVIFICRIESAEFGSGSIVIHNNHMEMWGVNQDDLRNVADRNTSRLLKPVVRTLGECISEENEFCGDIPFDFLPMFVLTNKLKVDGATGILDKGILKEFADNTASDFYILPSSIHELILLPLLGDLINEEGLGKMIREINSEKLSPDEILSDHAYKYIRSTGEVIMLEGGSDE